MRAFSSKILRQNIDSAVLLTINNPQARNALSNEVLNELNNNLKDIE